MLSACFRVAVVSIKALLNIKDKLKYGKEMYKQLTCQQKVLIFVYMYVYFKFF